MKNTFENALDYVNKLDRIDDLWSKSEKTLASAFMSYAAKVVENNCVLPLVSSSDFDKAKALLKELTDDERMEVFGDYCKYCGSINPSCQCWNDE